MEMVMENQALRQKAGVVEIAYKSIQEE